MLGCWAEKLKAVLAKLNRTALMFFYPFAQIQQYTMPNVWQNQFQWLALLFWKIESYAENPIQYWFKGTLGRLYIYHHQFPSKQHFWYSGQGFNDTFWNDLSLRCLIMYQKE